MRDPGASGDPVNVLSLSSAAPAAAALVWELIRGD